VTLHVAIHALLKGSFLYSRFLSRKDSRFEICAAFVDDQIDVSSISESYCRVDYIRPSKRLPCSKGKRLNILQNNKLCGHGRLRIFRSGIRKLTSDYMISGSSRARCLVCVGGALGGEMAFAAT
jgi:hypothetical protein